MALYRSKLGPVGGGNDSGTSEGGVVVDLDPLSAFALMDDGTTEDLGGTTSNVVSSSRRVGTKPSPHSATVAPPRKDHNPSLGGKSLAGETKKNDSGRWRVSDLSSVSPSQQRSPQPPAITTLGPTVDDTAAAPAAAYPSKASSSNLGGGSATTAMPARMQSQSGRRPPLSLASPSPPMQLQGLGEGSPFPSSKSGKSVGRKSASGSSALDDSLGHEASTEKIDPLEILRAEGIECLNGELLLVKLQNASVEALHGNMVPGVLIMTTYKLVLIPHKTIPRTSAGTNPHGAYSGLDERYFPFGHLPKEYLQVPMTYIDRVERDSERKGTPRVDRYFSLDGTVTIHCKDAKRIRVSFGGPEESERAMKMLQQLAFPGQQMEHLFAFSHHNSRAGLPDPGWHIFDPRKELDRMGVLKPRRKASSPWRTTDLNLNYGLCASYPPLLVVPASVTDMETEATAQFRSEQRLPVLCWGRQADSASIWRSSQPKIGMSRATCAEDERMLTRLAAESPSRILPIVDCRPRSNATANFATGYGYESYADCPLEFSGIGNIHVMRESLAKLENLCLGSTAKDNDWTSVVEDTRWLSHVRTVLSSAWTVAFKAHTQRTPVLVHCSHGWDRTSQVCSLAQMLLDPFYRTMDGFQVLIEKEWLAFGHPFHLRHAYGLPRGVTSAKEDQRSPIFLQFLDCTWQLVMQLPSFFEFNPRYLLCIADHIQSCRFGTFLCNTDKARKEAKLEQRCGSLWTFLELHRASFLSKLYHSDTQEVLMPPLSCILRHVRLWSDYFLRWSHAPSITPLPIPLRDQDSSKDSVSRDSTSTSTRGNSGRARSAGHQSGDLSSEPYQSTVLPLFRCEFDEMERWVTLYGREADRWRRKALGDSDSRHEHGHGGYGGDRWTGSIGALPGSEQADSEDLAVALKEIAKLKAALAEKDELVALLLSSGAPQVKTAPAKSTGDRGIDPSENDSSGTSTSKSASASTWAGAAAEAAVAFAAKADDDDDWFLDDRPRGHSSLAETRQARRSSMSDMDFEEDRVRCMSGTTADDLCDIGIAQDDFGGVGVRGMGRGEELSRTNNSRKWEFSGWGVGTGSGSGGKGSGTANGVVVSRRAGTRK